MMSYWEFRSECLNAVHEVVGRAQHDEIDHARALEIIEQICTEGDVAYEDGERIGDDELRAKLAEDYGEARPLSWEASR